MNKSTWWDKIPDTWKIVITIIGGITMVIGTYRTVESHYTARCDFEAHQKQNKLELAEVSEAFTKSVIRQDMRWNNEEQYKLEKKVRENPNDDVAQKRLHQLKDEQRQMETDLASPIAPKNSTIPPKQ